MPPVPKNGWEDMKRRAARAITPGTPEYSFRQELLSMLTVRVPPDLIERAKIRAIKEKSTLQKIVAAALEAYLKTAIGPKGKGR